MLTIHLYWIKGKLRGYAIRSGRRPSGSQRSLTSLGTSAWPYRVTTQYSYFIPDPSYRQVNMLEIKYVKFFPKKSKRLSTKIDDWQISLWWLHIQDDITSGDNGCMHTLYVFVYHYSDVIMDTMASQITSLTIVIGFNHGVMGLAENPARGIGFWSQNTEGVARGVLTEKARPEGCVFIVLQPLLSSHY